MFSGGFDSMLMALLARRWGAKLTAVTVQFEGFNPRTVAQASLLARRMKLPHHILDVSLSEFLSSYLSLVALMGKPPDDLDLVLVDAALKKYDPRIAGKIFISGMGSDQWFGNDALKVKYKDIKKHLARAVDDREIHCKVARVHGLKFIFPFLSTPMLALAQQIPPVMKKDKKLLRQLVTGADMDLLSGFGGSREIQVPSRVRHLLLKVYSKKVG